MGHGKNVKALLNIKYGDDPRQCLDVYMPPGDKKHSVIFFVHGGIWSTGERKEYRNIGHFFAKQGYVTVLADHRVNVAHPTHIKDVAKAFAWTKSNIEQFQGNNDKIYLFGHSSGAHLVALLAVNRKYIKDEGFDNSDIKGVVAVSGIYSLGINIVLAGFGDIFPKPEDRIDASPINFIDKNVPPFLIMYAENEIITFGSQSVSFYKALKNQKVEASIQYIKGQDHYTIITDCASNNVSGKTILNFTK